MWSYLFLKQKLRQLDKLNRKSKEEWSLNRSETNKINTYIDIYETVSC